MGHKFKAMANKAYLYISQYQVLSLETWFKPIECEFVIKLAWFALNVTWIKPRVKLLQHSCKLINLQDSKIHPASSPHGWGLIMCRCSLHEGFKYLTSVGKHFNMCYTTFNMVAKIYRIRI